MGTLSDCGAHPRDEFVRLWVDEKAWKIYGTLSAVSAGRMEKPHINLASNRYAFHYTNVPEIQHKDRVTFQLHG